MNLENEGKIRPKKGIRRNILFITYHLIETNILH